MCPPVPPGLFSNETQGTGDISDKLLQRAFSLPYSYEPTGLVEQHVVGALVSAASIFERRHMHSHLSTYPNADKPSVGFCPRFDRKLFGCGLIFLYNRSALPLTPGRHPAKATAGDEPRDKRVGAMLALVRKDISHGGLARKVHSQSIASILLSGW